MLLIHTQTNTPFDLSSDTEVSLEFANPYFEQSGSMSLPFTLPDTPVNRRLLDFAQRLDTASGNIRSGYTYQQNFKTPVVLQQGSFRKACTLLLLSYSPEEGFETTVLLGESSIWSRLKDVSLRDVFAGVSATPSATDRMMHWLGQIQKYISTESSAIKPDLGSDELVAFPVYSEKGYINYIYPIETVRGILPTIAYAHYTGTDSDEQNYEVDGERLIRPKGCGVTLFLKLKFVIEYIFKTYLGITKFVIDTPPSSSAQDHQNWLSVFSKIVVVNNTIDTIITGTVFYDTLVPDIPVLDFLQSLFAMFGIGFFQLSDDEVRMRFLYDTLAEDKAADISAMVAREAGISYEDAKRAVVEMEHIRQDGDAELTDYNEMQRTHPVCEEDDYGRFFITTDGEQQLLCYDQFDLLSLRGRQTLASAQEAEEISNSLSDTHLVDNEQIRINKKLAEMSHNLITHTSSYYAYKMPLLPGLNNRVCSIQNTDEDGGVTDMSQSTECPLLFCYCNTYHVSGYLITDDTKVKTEGDFRLGTPYYDHGVQHTRVQTLDLTARGICQTLQKAYNDVLHQGTHHLTVVANMSMLQLQQFDFSQPVSYHGRRFLPLKLQVSLQDAPVQQVTMEMMAI